MSSQMWLSALSSVNLLSATSRGYRAQPALWLWPLLLAETWAPLLPAAADWHLHLCCLNLPADAHDQPAHLHRLHRPLLLWVLQQEAGRLQACLQQHPALKVPALWLCPLPARQWLPRPAWRQLRASAASRAAAGPAAAALRAAGGGVPVCLTALATPATAAPASSAACGPAKVRTWASQA